MWIGIAETINNTDEAVTAFEMWLFDREDIHATPAYFLLSDFAYSNDEIRVSRRKNKGGFDKISEGKEYSWNLNLLQMTG